MLKYRLKTTPSNSRNIEKHRLLFRKKNEFYTTKYSEANFECNKFKQKYRQVANDYVMYKQKDKVFIFRNYFTGIPAIRQSLGCSSILQKYNQMLFTGSK